MFKVTEYPFHAFLSTFTEQFQASQAFNKRVFKFEKGKFAEIIRFLNNIGKLQI